MLRLVTNIPLPVHILLLVMIPLLRLPSFDGGFFLAEESFYLLAARKLAEGGHLYADLWHAGPPMMVWLYRAVYSIFGESTLTAMRVLTCFYLYFTSIYLAGTFSLFKPFKRYPGLPAILFAFLVSTPWYSQQVGASLLVLLPISVAFFSIMQLGDKVRQNNYRMFRAGIWLMLCILISYRFVFLVLGILIAYLLLNTPRRSEVLSMLGGMLLIAVSMVLTLFYSDSLPAFGDVGIGYYLDRIGFGKSPMYTYEIGFTLQAILRSWGIILVLSLLGFLHFRVRFFSYVAQIRTVELTMAIWLVSALLMLGFKYSRLELGDFLMLTPPVAFYASKVFDFKWAGKIQLLLFPAMFFMAVWMYLHYWGIVSPEAMRTFYPANESVYLHGNQKSALEPSAALYRYPFEPQQSIWIMDYQPQQYLRLKQKCENKYLDFRILWHKLPGLAEQNPQLVFSTIEPEQRFFEELSQAPPTYILDPHDNFAYFQQRYPTLFGNYQAEHLTDWTVYRRRE